MNEKDIAKYIEELKGTGQIKFEIKGSRNNSPRPIKYYNSKKLFVPDVVISYKEKRDYYVFESKINENDIALLIFKWILFAAEAKKLKGQFHLIVAKSNFAYCKKVIFDKQLEIELSKI